jgi:hypothetical protein
MGGWGCSPGFSGNISEEIREKSGKNSGQKIRTKSVKNPEIFEKNFWQKSGKKNSGVFPGKFSAN